MNNDNYLNAHPGWVTLGLLWLYAVVMGLLGAAMVYGGAILLKEGGSPYYILAGGVMVIAAGLLAARRRRGAWLFGAVLAASAVWAIWEVGFDFWALLPRLLLLLCFGIWLVMPWTQAALRRTETPSARQGARTALSLAAMAMASVAIGFLLYAFGADRPADPRFQAGIAAVQKGTSLAHKGDAGEDWPFFGGDLGGTRFTPLSEITQANIGSLAPVWEVDVGKVPGMNASPIKIGERIFTCDNQNGIFALEAGSGKQIWYYNGKGAYGSSCRGVSHFEVPAADAAADGLCNSRILAGNATAQLIALDAQTGALCPGFGQGGLVDLTPGMGDINGEVIGGYYRVTSAPLVVRGKVIIGGWITDNQYWGSPSGVIRAFDAVTGDFVWAWDLGRPNDHGQPAANQHYTHSTPNSWAPMAADAERGMVYLPTGNATPDFFGANRRTFDDKYSSSVVALNVETGERVWHFQTMHHDLWDQDVPAQASLLDLAGPDGVMVPALIQPTKQGEIFVLNRITGEPIFDVTETPVPQSGAVPEERLSPTQPRSDALPSFRGAMLREADMWGISPLDQLYCRIKFRQARYEGPQTPPGLTPSIQYPAAFGAINWGSVAVDPKQSIMVVNSNLLANYVQLIPRDEATALGLKRQGEWGNPFELALGGPQEETPYAVRRPYWLTGLGIPCNAPPYGLISAVDLKTGKLIWSQRLGTSLGSGPFGIGMPFALAMGTPNHGGALVTESGLVFIGAAKDNILRAYDLYTGETVWSYELPGGGHSAPISYMLNGRQYIAVHAGGSYAVQSRMSTKMIAFALPETTAPNPALR